MAELNIPDGHPHGGKGSTKKMAVKVDLTPMVDLAFLLITFFMLTTSLLKQKAMELNEPRKGPVTQVSECQVLNLLTDSLGNIYYWEGLDCKEVSEIGLKGDHNLKDKIRYKSNYLRHNCLYPSGEQKNLICLIKLLPGSHYDHMIRLLDEVATDSVPTYAIQAYSADEEKAVHREQQKLAMR
jgi:biopolymer transport protein ExbD